MAAFRIAFQLTRSRGAWLVDSFDEIVIFDFNSHAHVERDSVMYIRPRAKAISTHTLTWSVTPWCRHPAGGYQFQLTRSRGAWRHTLNNIWTAQIFQLTRSRGAWRLHWIFFPYHNNFNSHAHVERDKSQIVALEVTINFNSHAHVERDFQARQQRLHQGNFNSHAHVERDKSL